MYCKNCEKEVETYLAIEGTINCIECFGFIQKIETEESKPAPLGVCIADGIKVSAK